MRTALNRLFGALNSGFAAFKSGPEGHLKAEGQFSHLMAAGQRRLASPRTKVRSSSNGIKGF